MLFLVWETNLSYFTSTPVDIYFYKLQDNDSKSLEKMLNLSTE